jgi:hypothetical protein
MNRFLKIFILLIGEVSGFAAALLGYEGLKYFTGSPSTIPLWGIDIPLYYQTPRLYAIYCSGWAIWFFILCAISVFSALHNRKWLSFGFALLILLSAFAFIVINGRHQF